MVHLNLAHEIRISEILAGIEILIETLLSLPRYHMGLDAGKPVLGGLQTTKAQTSLHMDAIVIPLLESIISKLATSEILSF